MEPHASEARELFMDGYNCAQATLCAYCEETGMAFEDAVKLAASFGGGMGGLREVCGAVTGMFMVAGLKYGYTAPDDPESKAKHYELIASLAKRFEQANGSIICRDLLEIGKARQNPAEDYNQHQWCEQLIEHAGHLLDELIKKTEETSMKIAVASEGKLVTGHFGHCENFNIFEAENGKITSTTSVPNPGHKPGFLPNFLNDMGVNVIISGGMGGGAVEIFNEKNIEVITGAQGSAEAAANDYLQGNLKSTGSVCHEHQHHDSYGG